MRNIVPNSVWLGPDKKVWRSDPREPEIPASSNEQTSALRAEKNCMTWPIRLFPSKGAVLQQFGYIPTGAMWYAPFDVPEQESPFYVRDWKAKRLPLWVKMPTGGDLCVDSRFYDLERHGGYYGNGWTVTGTPPTITLQPSVNLVGSYHGYIRNGVITDDVEHHAFPYARGFLP